MSALNETLSEFEEQLRLQAAAESAPSQPVKKTRVDDDGSVMEWDEQRKGWFPKIDDDFIASYQINFGIQQQEQPKTAAAATTLSPEQLSAHAAWANFAAQIEQLKAATQNEGTELSEEIKKAEASLAEYYASPAYRLWYEDFQRSQAAETAPSAPAPSPEQPRKPRAAAAAAASISADEALARAEEEQRLGIPIVQPTTPAPSNGGSGDNSEPATAASGTEAAAAPRKRKKNGPPEWYEIEDEKNTHVYVSGLPPSITESDFVDLMSKCGMIMNDPLTEKLRVKLYKDADGKNKGDGLCCYIKIESIDLALQILDGMLYEPGYTLHVERAKFQPKKDFDATKHRRLTAKEKKKFKKQQEKLFKWGVDASRLIRGKKERVVILRSVFDEADLGVDVSLIPIVRERVRLQCAKVGVVKKIVVYDSHKEGIVSVTFSSPEEADVAIKFLDKALFTYPAPDPDGCGKHSQGQRTRILSVARWDGQERFEKKEDQEDEEARLARWNKFLDGSEAKEEKEEQSSEEEGGTATEEKVDAQTDKGGEQSEHEEDPVDTDEEFANANPDSGAETE
nr:unnamed protein product [Spirometra erinaceieuropaei]